MAEQPIPATGAPVQGHPDALDKFLGRLQHPVGYPHSAIPFAERFPNLRPGALATVKKDYGYGDPVGNLDDLAIDLRILFGVPLPHEYSPESPEADTVEAYVAHHIGGSHGDQRRAIDDLKDRIIESIAHDVETVRALDRSIGSRLAALEALEAMMLEAAIEDAREASHE